MLEIPIIVDVSEAVQSAFLTEAQGMALGTVIIDRIVENYETKWNKLIETNLKQSRSEYEKAKYIQRFGNLEAVFGLTDRQSKLPLMIENGVLPFDQKIGFEKSGKVKIKNGGGWYLTIPFRHATSKAVAESGVFSTIMPKEIYNIAKKKSPVTAMDLPINHLNVGVRATIDMGGIKVPEYVHKTPIYQGLSKINVASTSKEIRSSYMTFRRVSDKSDFNSWWYPGLNAKNLMDRALEMSDIGKVTDLAIDEFFNNL